MTVNISFAATPVIKGPSANDHFSYSISETPKTWTPPQYTYQVDDIIYTVTEYSGTDNNYSITLTPSVNFPGYEMKSLTPTICSVTPTGAVARILDGVGTVQITSGRCIEQITRTFAHTTGTPATTTSDYEAPSLAKHILTNIANMIAAKSPGATTQNTYTSNDYATNNPTVVRNPNLFCKSYDMTHMTVSSSLGGHYPSALISKRHVIRAIHVDPTYTMSKVNFLDRSGNIRSANIVSHSVLSSIDASNLDTVVFYLDRDIDYIEPAYFLPSDFMNYLPSVDSISLPAVSKGWTAGDKIRLEYFTITGKQNVYDSATKPSSWYEDISPGDSSGLYWFPIDGRLVLLDCIYTTGGGDSYADYRTAIETAMNQLASAAGNTTTYSLNTVDLRGFKHYP